MYRGSGSEGLGTRMGPQRGHSGAGRLLIGLVMAVFALVSYLGSRTVNTVTGETQYVGITQEQEIALGLQSTPQMIEQYGGLDPSAQRQGAIDGIGKRLIAQSMASQTQYPNEFNLLADQQTINAFALPGGPAFMTDALFDRLNSEGQVAGVLGHEIGHVIARHGAQRIAKQQLTEGLTGALVLATYDPNAPRTQRTAQVALVIGQLVNMKYGREDELESDRLGVRIMSEAGYDPRSMIRVMQVLEESAGGSRQPEFFSPHPNPENRIAYIEQAIQELYPNGVPEGLQP